MVLRLKRKYIPLKGMSVDCSPVPTLEEETSPPLKGSPPTWICFVPVETEAELITSDSSICLFIFLSLTQQ